MSVGCGGCRGLGAHRRWCAAHVGSRASLLGRASDAVADWGDRIGSHDMDLANACWDLAARLNARAVGAARDGAGDAP